MVRCASLFSQLVTLFNKSQFYHLVKEHRAERYGKGFSSWDLYTLTREISYKEAAATLKDRIRKAPSQAEALKLLESFVPDVPPLDEDKVPAARG